MLKSYPNKMTVPQRMSRKRIRQEIFTHNKKMAKLRRKVLRLARKAKQAE